MTQFCVNYSVHHASFVQTIIYNFNTMEVHEPLHSAVHPMKYVENNVV